MNIPPGIDRLPLKDGTYHYRVRIRIVITPRFQRYMLVIRFPVIHPKPSSQRFGFHYESLGLTPYCLNSDQISHHSFKPP